VSIRGYCRDIGQGKSYISNILSRSDGWHYPAYYSQVNLTPDQVPIMTLAELKEYLRLP
jgi:hypothetical protein